MTQKPKFLLITALLLVAAFGQSCTKSSPQNENDTAQKSQEKTQSAAVLNPTLAEGCYVSRSDSPHFAMLAVKALENGDLAMPILSAGCAADEPHLMAFSHMIEKNRAGLINFILSPGGLTAEAIHAQPRISCWKMNSTLTPIWSSELEAIDFSHCEKLVTNLIPRTKQGTLEAKALKNFERQLKTLLHPAPEATGVAKKALSPNVNRTEAPAPSLSLRLLLKKRVEKLKSDNILAYKMNSVFESLEKIANQSCAKDKTRALIEDTKKRLAKQFDDQIIEQVATWIEPISSNVIEKHLLSSEGVMAPVLQYYRNEYRADFSEAVTIAKYSQQRQGDSANFGGDGLGFYFALPRRDFTFKSKILNSDLRTCGSTRGDTPIQGAARVEGLEDLFRGGLQFVFGTRHVIFVADELQKDESAYLETVVHELRHLLDDLANSERATNEAIRTERAALIKKLRSSFNISQSYRKTKDSSAYKAWLADMIELCKETQNNATQERCRAQTEKDYLSLFNSLWLKYPYFLSSLEQAGFREEMKFLKTYYGFSKERASLEIIFKPELVLMGKSLDNAYSYTLRSGKVLDLLPPTPDFLSEYLDDLYQSR